MQELTDDERDVVECNLRLAGWFVDKVRRPDEDRDELFQAAIPGLARAVQTCDAELASLQTHAISHMRAAIQNHRQHARSLIHVPSCQRFTATATPEYADDVARADAVRRLAYHDGELIGLPDPSHVDPIDAMADREALVALRLVRHVALPERQATVVKHRLAGTLYKDMPDAMGVSRETAKKIERQAHATLGRYMAKYA